LRPLSVTSYLSQSITRSPRVMVLEAPGGVFFNIASLRRRTTSSGVHGWKQTSIWVRDVVIPSRDKSGMITTTGIPASAALLTSSENPRNPAPAAQIRAHSTPELSFSLFVSDVKLMNCREGSRVLKDVTKRNDSGFTKPKRATEFNYLHQDSIS